MEQVISKILEILDTCENAFEVLQVVLMTLLVRKYGKSLKTSEKGESKLLTSSEVPETVVSDVHIARSTKKSFKAFISDGIDLYYSDKKYEEMSETEKLKFDAAKRFIEGDDDEEVKPYVPNQD